MNYLCTEISHQTVDLEKLQEVIPNNQTIDEIYNSLYAPDNEIFILKTCFRFLIFSRNICKLTLDEVLDKLQIKQGIRILSDADAIERLFVIAGGLDSPFLGEGEIVAQFKSSYENAQQKMALGPHLQQILKTALFTGKKIRTETDLGSTSSAYSSVAAQLIKQHSDSIRQQQILILGTGSLAEQLYTYFHKKSSLPILVSSASEERASAFCVGKNAEVHRIHKNKLDECHIILAASNNLSKIEIESNPQQIIIDFGMPTNIQHSGKGNYYTMSDVKKLQETKNETKRAALTEANQIIQQELKVLEFWLRSRKVVPLIQDFRQKAEDIKQEEWDWAKTRLGDISIAQEAVLQKLMNRLVSRLTSRPVAKIKDFAQNEHTESNINTFKEIFDL